MTEIVERMTRHLEIRKEMNAEALTVRTIDLKEMLAEIERLRERVAELEAEIERMRTPIRQMSDRLSRVADDVAKIKSLESWNELLRAEIKRLRMTLDAVAADYEAGNERLRAERLKLDRRIHNQRVALRETWEIVEMRRKWLGSDTARRLYCDLLKRYQKLRTENEWLRLDVEWRVQQDEARKREGPVHG